MLAFIGGNARAQSRGSLCRSTSVRKSIVPNWRSIAGGPQIRAPIARYARNNLDEAPAVAEAGSFRSLTR